MIALKTVCHEPEDLFDLFDIEKDEWVRNIFKFQIDVSKDKIVQFTKYN